MLSSNIDGTCTGISLGVEDGYRDGGKVGVKLGVWEVNLLSNVDVEDGSIVGVLYCNISDNFDVRQ